MRRRVDKHGCIKNKETKMLKTAMVQIICNNNNRVRNNTPFTESDGK
ncbi:hypothetical protein, unlikely [Trypanosoma brucei brucei TREU927]|uniref:Uncharacterized protein n=1 Tax=Trypanosoma brucei brucei (strain 927/4 GUTat10.1) TaxID=185431 RepID=Q38EZ1_TRYB2|nr:hypothetical protein, unlikely [Trypanosoma brucei brucei TREU927]EAN76629.1 hypothetical protein, unlikely [Trypanosoma brucei brucei TREU927]